MRWVKHLVDTWEDEKIAKLVKGGGIEGLAAYGMWWRIVEIIAKQVDAKSPKCSVTYDVTRWSVLLSVRGSHVRNWLVRLSLTGLLTAEWNGTDITVTIPNLLKYRDEYSKKSIHAPADVHPKTEGEQKERESVGESGDSPPAQGDPSGFNLEQAPAESSQEFAPVKKQKGSAGTRISVEALPEEWLKWAIDKLGWSGRTSLAVFERFVDYWRSAAGDKGRKADWFATWRNWCRKEDETIGAAQSNGSNNGHGKIHRESDAMEPWVDIFAREEAS